MARIYDSAQQRVTLEERKDRRGFAPGRAASRSGAVAKQSADWQSQFERAQAFQQRNIQNVGQATLENYQKTSGASLAAFENVGRARMRNNQAAVEFQSNQALQALEFTNNQASKAQGFAIDQAQQRNNLYLSQLESAISFKNRNQRQTLETLSQFSETLSGFLAAKQKAENEEQEKLGIMDGMNGVSQPDPSQVATFKTATKVLEDAAVVDGQTNEAVSKVNLPMAENDRVSSPIRKGWYAHGFAKGTLKRAASVYQVAMDSFMDSKEKIVPLPDGSFISPSEARGPAQLSAALSVGQQIFIEGQGLTRFNRLMVFEHLTPTVMQVNDSILANRLAAGRKADKEEAIEKVNLDIGVNWQTLDPRDPAAVQDFFQSSVAALRAEGMGRADANDQFIQRVVTLAKATGTPQSLELLAAIEQTPVNPDVPEWGTLGQRYPEQFKEAFTSVVAEQEKLEEQREEEENELVARILADYNGVLIGAGTDPQALKQAFDEARQALVTMAPRNMKAQEALLQLEAKGMYHNPFAEAQIMQAIEQGAAPPSEAQLDQLVMTGTISGEAASRIRARKPSDRATKLAKDSEPTIRAAARAAIMANFSMTTISGEEAKGLVATMEDALTAEVAVPLRSQMNNWLEQGKVPTPMDVAAFIQSRVEQAAKQPKYNGTFKDGRIRPNAPLSTSAFVTRDVNPNTGQRLSDFTRVDPYIIRTQQPPLTSTAALTPEELTQNTQAFLNGAKPSTRAERVMRAKGVSFEQFLRDQHKAYGLPFTDISQSQLAKSAAERRRVAPAAAAIIDNPNIPAWRKLRAFQSVNQAIARAQQRADAARAAATPSAAMAGGDAGKAVQAFRPLMDIIGVKEGGAKAYDAINRGEAGDTPAGYKGLSNMTLAQVQQLQSNGYNAVGRYQFIRSTLDNVIRESGLDPNTTKFTPQVQDQLFVQLLTGRSRPRLAAFLRGENNDVASALSDLSNEFAVIKNFTGRSGIEGIAGNRSSIEPTQAAQMLKRVRDAYRAARISSSAGEGVEAYVIDSLGYRSTGPHVDVKPVRPGTMQTDRNLPPYTKGTLDRFVDIKLPDGRVGPLSTLSVTTDDDTAHRSRKKPSFGHDYAAPKGSVLVLKNGARVVGSFQGDEGTDHVIIELPDGRRFQWLHGKKL